MKHSSTNSMSEPSVPNVQSNVKWDIALKNLYLDLFNLIVESRTPGINDRGYGDGKHCPPIFGPNVHLCDLSVPECQKHQRLIYHLLRAVRENAFEIEVLMLPDCCSESKLNDRIQSKEYVLLERWSMNCIPSQSLPTIDVSELLRAVRSFLHFSQISAWLSLTKGKSPLNIYYWVKPTADPSPTKFENNTDVHVFPVCKINDGHYGIVKVNYPIRKQYIPIIPCSKHPPRQEIPFRTLTDDTKLSANIPLNSLIVKQLQNTCDKQTILTVNKCNTVSEPLSMLKSVTHNIDVNKRNRFSKYSKYFFSQSALNCNSNFTSPKDIHVVKNSTNARLSKKETSLNLLNKVLIPSVCKLESNSNQVSLQCITDKVLTKCHEVPSRLSELSFTSGAPNMLLQIIATSQTVSNTFYNESLINMQSNSNSLKSLKRKSSELEMHIIPSNKRQHLNTEKLNIYHHKLFQSTSSDENTKQKYKRKFLNHSKDNDSSIISNSRRFFSNISDNSKTLNFPAKSKYKLLKFKQHKTRTLDLKLNQGNDRLFENCKDISCKNHNFDSSTSEICNVNDLIVNSKNAIEKGENILNYPKNLNKVELNSSSLKIDMSGDCSINSLSKCNSDVSFKQDKSFMCDTNVILKKYTQKSERFKEATDVKIQNFNKLPAYLFKKDENTLSDLSSFKYNIVSQMFNQLGNYSKKLIINISDDKCLRHISFEKEPITEIPQKQTEYFDNAENTVEEIISNGIYQEIDKIRETLTSKQQFLKCQNSFSIPSHNYSCPKDNIDIEKFPKTSCKHVVGESIASIDSNICDSSEHFSKKFKLSTNLFEESKLERNNLTDFNSILNSRRKQSASISKSHHLYDICTVLRQKVMPYLDCHSRHKQKFGRRKRLLGNFEESILKGCFIPVCIVKDFHVEIGASGNFYPSHLRLPANVYFYEMENLHSGITPYMAEVLLSDSEYCLPKKGAVQVTLFNPSETVVKMFVLKYDLSDMPPMCHTFIRQKTYYMPLGSNEESASSQKWLRFIIHLRFASSKTGKLFLHKDIKIVVLNKSNDDAAFEFSQEPYELRSFLHVPMNPKFSLI